MPVWLKSAARGRRRDRQRFHRAVPGGHSGYFSGAADGEGIHGAGRGLPGRACSGFLGKPGTDCPRQVERTFVPEMGMERRDKLYAGWKRAVKATLVFGNGDR